MLLPLLRRRFSTQSGAKMTKFDIEIVSDTVCPWCYVGKRKLDKAIQTWKELHPDSNDEFNITWKPFYLNPNMPTESVDKHAFHLAKFGPERLQQVHSRLAQIGLDNGIKFSFAGRTGNTRSSHRLIQLARQRSPATQSHVVAELFKTYFEDSGDITSLDVLTAAGARAGLDEREVREWLESGKGGDEVDREVEQAREDGISGVPNFTLNRRFQVGGAQDEDVFLGLWERIRGDEERKAARVKTEP